MKRTYDEISALADGNAMPESNVGKEAGNGAVKAEPSSSAAPLEQSASGVAGLRGAVSGGESTRRKCPYLDTINRNVLDFDFEKVWS